MMMMMMIIIMMEDIERQWKTLMEGYTLQWMDKA